MKNEEYINELSKNKSETTHVLYKTSLEPYSEFTNQTLDELIKEAIKNQDNSLTKSQIELSKKLSNYREYLKTVTYKDLGGHPKKYKASTINTKIQKIKAFYRHYYIFVPETGKVKDENKEKLKDIVTLEEFTTVINGISNIKHKSLIGQMGSSGIPTDDILKLTQKDVVIATSEYHNFKDINDVVPYLLKLDTPIIPTWNYVRGKTGIEAITFQSAESMHDLLLYLNSLIDLDNEKRVYDLARKGVIGIFSRINKKFNFGKTSTGRNKFHAHGMRSFFSTQLFSEGVDSLAVDFMMAHSIPSTQAAYFKANPKKLRQKYIRVMNSVSTIPVRVVDIKSPEVIALEKENKQLKENINKQVDARFDEKLAEALNRQKIKNLDDKIREYNK
jgi:integrase